jgi:hypothetical protein
MAVEQLSDELKRKGQNVLTMLDNLGLEPQGMLWLHFPHLRDWRLTVITDLVETLGRKRAYDLIGSALDHVGPIDGLTVFDLHIAAPSEVIPRVLGGTFILEDGMAELRDSQINDIPINAVLYRLRKARPQLVAKKSASRFEKSVAQLVH